MRTTKFCDRTLSVFTQDQGGFITRTAMRLVGGLVATLLMAAQAHATPPWEMLNDYRTSKMEVVEATGEIPREPVQVTLNGPTITLEQAYSVWHFRLVDYAQSWCGVQEFIAEPLIGEHRAQTPNREQAPLLITLYDYTETECGETRSPQWELVAEAPIGHFRLVGNPTGEQIINKTVP